MLKLIKEAFYTCDEFSCHEMSNLKQIRIHDAEGSRCYINPAPNENFRAVNNNQKEINFVAIDYCLFEGLPDATERCECVLFDDTFFCFIELKNSGVTTGRTARGHRRTAADQIIETYKLFRNRNISFEGYSLEGYISFVVDPPTAVTATSLTDRFNLSEYGIEYYEAAFKEFS